jgi:radical SAM-linked protein
VLALTQVRIKFAKTGRAKYISHLDLSRCMSRALRRAKIPIWFTQGFNPHPYIFFALPLSLGYESECEFMDLRLEAEMSFEDVKRSFVQQMPEGIEILEVYEPQTKISEIGYSLYKISFEYSNADENELHKILDALKQMPEILITKKTKTATREIDIKKYFIGADFVVSENSLQVTACLPSGNEETVNPNCFSDAIEKYCGIYPQFESIKRLNVFHYDMREFR